MAVTKLLSRNTVCERLDITRQTLAAWIESGRFPAATVSLPGAKGDKPMERWEESVVEGWLIMLKSGFLAEPVKSK